MALLMILLTAGFVSCSKSNDDDSESKLTIVGSWLLDGVDYTETYTFTSNGTGTYDSYDKGTKKTETDPFKYTYSGDQLVIDYGDGDPETYTVTLTETTLKLADSDTHSITYTKKK